MKRATAGILAIATSVLPLVAGCAPTGPEGRLALTSRTANPLRLDASFAHGSYAVDPAGVSIIMSTVPLDALRDGKFETAQVVDVRLLWEPRAGRTPVSRDATNLVIRHVILVDGEVGIYGGGGFGWPSGTPGETGFGLEITGSSVSLVDSTQGFVDLMSPASLLGSIAGPLDAATTVEFRDTITQIVTDRLGRARWVHLPSGESSTAG
ncbi:MAG: hypothetical protein VX726_12860 [Planctomycetota bacterium]|nr:hypothetical protein [Planctomycetota bacterium]